MFKFLRKYSVWILGFGGTLLLIAFLAPNVIQQLAQEAGYAGTTQATVGDGEVVGYEEWQKIVGESQIIDRLGSTIPGVGKLDSPSHWFLLTREADLAGPTPPIQSIAIDEVTLFNIANNAGARPQQVLEALAHMQGVSRLARMYQRAGRFSDVRLRNAANYLLSSVEIETVVIPATPEDNGSFSDEAMEGQFEAWADTPNGAGDHGFGYKLPDRLKIEWLKIPADSITEATRKSVDFSSREQRKYWRRNESNPNFPAIGSTDDIPAEVSDAYLKQLASVKRSNIARSVSEQLRNPRRGFDELNGYIDLPDDWDTTKLNFEQLAISIQSEFDMSLPEYGANATWVSTEDAGTIPVIGSVQVVNQGSTPVNVQTLVSSAKEFRSDGAYRIQQSVSSPVYETADGDLVVFRLTETDPTRRPHSVEEVKDAVSYDLGRIARWEALQAETDLIEQLAREDGMLAASIKYDSAVNQARSVSMVDTGVPSILDPATARPLMAQTVIQRLSAGQQISDMVSSIPSLEQVDSETIQTITTRASSLPLDTPVASLPVDQQIFIVPSKENMALVLVRVTNTTPASKELASDFSNGNTAILQTMLSFDELGGAAGISDVFSFDQLAQRHNFERGSRAEDIVQDETTTEVN
jgi:hypothetical protein